MRPGTRTSSAVVGLALLTLTACNGGSGDDGTDDDAATSTVEELEIGGQAAVAVVPAGTPEGLVLYLHGFDEDARSLLDGDDQTRVVDRLVADGYVVAASDAHLNAFGDAASQQDYVDLAAELAGRYDTTRTFLLAESMGGIAGLQFLANEAIPDVLGLAAITPLTTLAVAVGTDYEEPLIAAYGGRLPMGTEDPAQLPAESFRGDAIRFYLSAEDTVTVPADNAEPFTARVAGIADVSTVSCTGGHVAPACFQPDDLADWFAGLVAAAPGS